MSATHRKTQCVLTADDLLTQQLQWASLDCSVASEVQGIRQGALERDTPDGWLAVAAGSHFLPAGPAVITCYK